MKNRFTTTQALLEEHRKRLFDVVFLDIEMVGESGLEAEKQLRMIKSDVIIIVVSSHVDLFQLASDIEPFRIVSKLDIEDRMPKVIASTLEKYKKGIRKYTFYSDWQPQVIALSDIMYFHKVPGSNYTEIVTTHGTHKQKKTIGRIHETLPQDEFIIIRASCIAAIEYIKYYIGNEITMSDGIKFQVGKNYAKSVKDVYEKYLNPGR